MVTEVTARAAHQRYQGIRAFVPEGLAVVRVAMDLPDFDDEDRIQRQAGASYDGME
jgi:hypothetical protein